MSRAVAPVVGVALLLLVTVTLSASVGVALSVTVPEPPPTVAVDVAADADDDRITLTHEGGDVVDTADLSLYVEIDGRELAHQPPVPFFAATGFESGPTGPFNSGGETTWRAGESASVALATTNSPELEPGASVTVRLTAGDATVAVAETRAG